jgi:membrane-associated phospholipid phosphatase
MKARTESLRAAHRPLHGALAWWAASLRAVRRRAREVGSGAREAAIMLGAYALYNVVRGVWGGTLAEGRENAADVISAERALGIYVEPAWQDAFVRHGLAMPFWNVLYVGSQVVVLPLTVFLVYRFRRRAYPLVRALVLIAWTAGVTWYALQPVAPPRLLAGGEFTDTVTEDTFLDLDSGFIEVFYNPVAAMPSLHVGMAPIVAFILVRLTGRWWLQALGWAYPVLILVCVVVTGNHFLLDAAGGLAVVLPAAAIAWLLTRDRPAAPRPTTARPAGG